MMSAAEARTPPAARPSRPLRILFAGLSLLLLALTCWAVRIQADYAVLPADVDLEALHFPLNVGDYVARELGELQQTLLSLDHGTTIDLDGTPVTLVPEVEGVQLWVTLLNALLFWAAATFVLSPRLRSRAVRDLYGCLVLTGLAVAISGPAADRGPTGFLLPALYFVALCLMPVFFLRFSLAFPRPFPFVHRRPRLMPALPLLGLVIAAWNIQAQLAWFDGPTPERYDALVLPTRLMQAHLVLGMAAGIVMLYLNGRGAELAREKRQVKWILWGIAIGATPFVFLRILPRLLFSTQWMVDPAVDRAVEMTIPVAITIAVVRERFMDIDVIIRRSLVYTAMALGAAGIVALGIRLAGRGTPLPDPWIWVLTGALPAALFVPARRWLSRWVDRTFFRIRYEHERALESLKQALVPAAGQPEIARGLCTFLGRALEPKALAVVVRSEGEQAVCGDLDQKSAQAATTLLAPLNPELGGVTARRDATAVPECERDDLPPELLAAGVHVAQPVAHDGHLHGLLLLGEKKNERRYIEEDLRLLADSAALVGETLERVELVQRVAEETLARRSLADLDRQKSEFFARVAHDLRTPLTAVGWSVRNMSEGLAGPLNQRQSDYLDSVSAAAAQLGRLVDNLVDLSRLDLDAPGPPPEPIDLGAVVEEAARALRAVAAEACARFEIHVAPGLPPVRGRPEAAFQIVINLLDNALKYTAEDTAVSVELTPDGKSHATLRVRDHGPGLPEGDPARLFDLFERGPESPRGPAKGFGIGLHVVKAWAEALGGSIEADNHPDGGARFTCRLPVWDQTEENA